MEPAARRGRGRVLLYAHLEMKSNWDANTPHGTPRDPQVESKDFSCTTYLNHWKRNDKLKSINFPLPGVSCPFNYRLL